MHGDKSQKQTVSGKAHSFWPAPGHPASTCPAVRSCSGKCDFPRKEKKNIQLSSRLPVESAEQRKWLGGTILWKSHVKTAAFQLWQWNSSFYMGRSCRHQEMISEKDVPVYVDRERQGGGWLGICISHGFRIILAGTGLLQEVSCCSATAEAVGLLALLTDVSHLEVQELVS